MLYFLSLAICVFAVSFRYDALLLLERGFSEAAPSLLLFTVGLVLLGALRVGLYDFATALRALFDERVSPALRGYLSTSTTAVLVYTLFALVPYTLASGFHSLTFADALLVIQFPNSLPLQAFQTAVVFMIVAPIMYEIAYFMLLNASLALTGSARGALDSRIDQRRVRNYRIFENAGPEWAKRFSFDEAMRQDQFRGYEGIEAVLRLDILRKERSLSFAWLLEECENHGLLDALYEAQRTGILRSEQRSTAETKIIEVSPRYLDAYRILGLTPGASKEEIKDAYKSLAKKYHPDKVANLGEELVTAANRRFREIQQAYETVLN